MKYGHISNVIVRSKNYYVIKVKMFIFYSASYYVDIKIITSLIKHLEDWLIILYVCVILLIQQMRNAIIY